MAIIFFILYIVVAARYVTKFRPTALTCTNWNKLGVDVLLTLVLAFTIVPVLFLVEALKMLFGVGLGCIAARGRR